MAEEKKAAAKKKEADLPDTPSGLALQKVGEYPAAKEGEPFDAEAANAHGEAYQAEKRKHRWG